MTCVPLIYSPFVAWEGYGSVIANYLPPTETLPHDNTPRTRVKDGLHNNGKGANADRGVHGDIWFRDIPKAPMFVVCAPLGLELPPSVTRPRGVVILPP